MIRDRHSSSRNLPTLTDMETHILQLRAKGLSYPAIRLATGIAPRKLWDIEKLALHKLIDYVETQQFLQGDHS